MSYLFDGTNDTMTGTMTSAYAGELVTMAFKMKVTAHPLAYDYMMSFGNSSSSTNDAHKILSNSADNSWLAKTTTAAASNSDAQINSKNIDGVWASFVYRVSSANLRDFFIDDLATTAQTTAGRDLTDGLKYVRLGETFTGAQDFAGRLAEVAIWDIALADADITSYMSGVPASSIQAADLIGYWPLDADNATQSNLGVDAGGDLSVTGAVYDADHPTMLTVGQPAHSRRRGIPGMNIIASSFGRGW